MVTAHPRFEVRELGPRYFVVHDNVSQLDYDPSFTRKAVQGIADRRNGRLADPNANEDDE